MAQLVASLNTCGGRRWWTMQLRPAPGNTPPQRRGIGDTIDRGGSDHCTGESPCPYCHVVGIVVVYHWQEAKAVVRPQPASRSSPGCFCLNDARTPPQSPIHLSNTERSLRWSCRWISSSIQASVPSLLECIVRESKKRHFNPCRDHGGVFSCICHPTISRPQQRSIQMANYTSSLRQSYRWISIFISSSLGVLVCCFGRARVEA